MRTPFVCANWKMHKTVADAVKFVKELRGLAKDVADVEIVVAPAFTAIHAAAEAARNSNVAIAAQDLHWEREGALTGEVSGAMVREAGAEYAIVGHSERRTLAGETDAMVNRKTAAAFAAGLIPIVCIGETAGERRAGLTLAVVERQLEESLPDAAIASDTVIAYEPVWAIGTGLTPSVADVAEVHGFLRDTLAGRFGAEGRAMRILYGGSVKPDNARELMAVDNVNGALVGGASLKSGEFLAIVAACGP